MDNSNAANGGTPSSTGCCPPRAASRGRTVWLIGIGALAVAVALYAGWGWLAATGVAAVLLSLAPCLVMCGLGLCAMRRKSGTSQDASGRE